MRYFLVTSCVRLHDYWNCTSELNPPKNIKITKTFFGFVSGLSIDSCFSHRQKASVTDNVHQLFSRDFDQLKDRRLEPQTA